MVSKCHKQHQHHRTRPLRTWLTQLFGISPSANEKLASLDIRMPQQGHKTLRASWTKLSPVARASRAWTAQDIGDRTLWLNASCANENLACTNAAARTHYKTCIVVDKALTRRHSVTGIGPDVTAKDIGDRTFSLNSFCTNENLACLCFDVCMNAATKTHETYYLKSAILSTILSMKLSPVATASRS